MSLLERNKASKAIAWNCLFLLSLISLIRLDIEQDSFVAQSTPSTTTSAPTCQQLTSRRYAVIVDRPAVGLNQLPDFLFSTAIACRYLNSPMTFFGSFERLESSRLRANQLKQLGIDASIHSFTDKQNHNNEQFRASALLVELTVNPNLALQQVKAITGKPSFFATFNNRSVILTAPLTNQQNASKLAYKLSNQGFATQVIDAGWINDRNSRFITKQENKSANHFIHSSKNSSVRRRPQILYRILVPVNQIQQVRQTHPNFPDAFQRTFSGHSYIQVRSYLDWQNAYREKERLKTYFSDIVLEAERIYQ